ncbi:transcriptional regulator [Gracilibacillus sp. YIM 98692]|uniref:transcriptional regulator n=1 Tax=Gracilibacillus sp. YIM 98692 TaxID=2663532 RepID=UPI0013D02FA4|nr:transcriptional regulator [Gracilibacillus sp. YIM 98692]
MFTALSKTERKKIIKIIEKHLKNYNSYKIAIINITDQLEHLKSRVDPKKKTHSEQIKDQERLENDLMELKLLVESIDRSLDDLSDLEVHFVHYRYFKKWSIEKSALNLGYSDKAMFSIRNQIMDKLIISLSSILEIETHRLKIIPKTTYS